MKTLFFECNMGAAGDMLVAALLELRDDPDDFIRRFNGIGLSGVEMTASRTTRYGISGTLVSVKVNGEEESAFGADGHSHGADRGAGNRPRARHGRSMRDMEEIITSLRVSEKVKKDALAIYNLIAEAESHAHQTPVTEIHFHEVGALDAVADIVGVCALMEELSPELVLSSPVHVGSGQVRCAHGTLPVPAPATARILRNIPIYSGDLRGELCTPTGAAILAYFVEAFGAMPVLSVSEVGYGMGKKDFGILSCVRTFWGESLSTNNR